MANKILQMCLSNGKGGMELYVDRLIEDLLLEGWEVIGICLKDTKVETYMRRNGVLYKAFASNGKALINLFMIRRWLIEEQVTVIHCHASSDLRLTTLLKALLPKLRIFYTDHVGGPRLKKSPYHRIAYGKVERVLSISEATYQRNIRSLPVSHERVVCLPHGVNLVKYQPIYDPTVVLAKREALGVPTHAVLIGLPGRVTPGKGQDVWVKALLKLDPALNFYALSIGGNDYASGGVEAFYAELKHIIEGTSLEDKITFLGHRSDLADILPVLDVVCIPSENEAFGLAVIESMACGMPIIASNTGSLPELVNADAGVLVGPFDVCAWHDAIDTLIRDVATRKALGRNARRRVEERFSNKQHVKRLMEIYTISA